MADPYSPDSSEVSTLPRWPKVVGTISIVWSSLGLLCGGCGITMMFVMPTMMKGAEEKLGPMPPAMFPGPEQMLAGGVGMVWAVLLLVAGIFTVTRKPLARPMHLVYAAGAVVLGIIGIMLQIKQMGELNAWVAANPDSGWAKQMKAPGSDIGRVFGLAVGALLSFGWSLFCLAWFAPPKRSAELAMRDDFV